MISLEILEFEEVHHLFNLILRLISHKWQTLEEFNLAEDLSVLDSFENFIEINFGKSGQIGFCQSPNSGVSRVVINKCEFAKCLSLTKLRNIDKPFHILILFQVIDLCFFKFGQRHISVDIEIKQLSFFLTLK